MKKNRQYRSNQGRSPRQVRDSEIATAIGFIGIVWIIGYLIIFG
jgi:hypothetical protein